MTIRYVVLLLSLFSALSAHPNDGFVRIIGQVTESEVHLGIGFEASEEAFELWERSFWPVDSPELENRDSVIIDVSGRGRGGQISIQDTTQLVPDSLVQTDSLFQGGFAGDSLSRDTVLITSSPDALDAPVDYNARDSIQYDIGGEIVYLYGEAHVQYDDFVLDADYIEFNWRTQTVSAWGIEDSTGKVAGKPDFKTGAEGFSADTVRYNFGSEKGKIYNMRTEQQGGFVIMPEAKRLDNEDIFGRNGVYTTCSNPEPHFHIQASKIKMVPDKLIATGPANLVIADVPTPLFVPFGIFPLNKQGKNSGLLLPEYGQSPDQGFYLRNGGWYFAISDQFDLALTGDIFSRGSWGVNLASNYRVRYKYNGRITANYASRRFGSPVEDDFRVTKDFRIGWTHNQDSKARPNSNFSANVNIGTSTYANNATFSIGDFLQNSLTSNVTYSRSFPGRKFRLDASLRHNQVIQTRKIDLTLPNVTFALNRVFPFEKKVSSGRPKWYEQIGFTYTARMENRISTFDSLLFRSDVIDDFQFGVSHVLPVSTSLKIFKNFTLNPSFTYNEFWYPNYIRKTFVADTLFTSDTTFNVGFVRTDTLNGFRAARFFNANVSLSTRMYSTWTSRGKGKFRALRLQTTPSVSFNWRPDFGSSRWNYYGEHATDFEGNTDTYSKFENGIFSSIPQGPIGGLSFALNNVLEAKAAPKDSGTVDRKIRILEALNVSTFYNMALDSFRWSNISMNGRTRLLDKIDLNFNANFDPYSRDSLGLRQRASEWKANRRFARFSSGQVALSTRLAGGTTAEGRSRPRWQEWHVWDLDPGYADFNVPWSVSLSYALRITNRAAEDGTDSLTTTQTLSANGDFNLSPKWKVRFSTGYDFERKDFTPTQISIDRDLHCWQMSFVWIPFGARQSYNFTLNVKSSILQPLRVNRRQDWFDEY